MRFSQIYLWKLSFSETFLRLYLCLSLCYTINTFMNIAKQSLIEETRVEIRVFERVGILEKIKDLLILLLDLFIGS